MSPRSSHDRAAAEPRINHLPLKDTEDDSNPTGELLDHSVYALIADDLLLHWNLDGGPTFTDVVLPATRRRQLNGRDPPSRMARRSTTTFCSQYGRSIGDPSS